MCKITGILLSCAEFIVRRRYDESARDELHPLEYGRRANCRVLSPGTSNKPLPASRGGPLSFGPSFHPLDDDGKIFFTLGRGCGGIDC